MGLNEYNISKMSDSFVATFLSACLQAKKVPFMDICLGFVHASKKILRYMVELNMLTKEQVEVIDRSLSEAIECDISNVENQKLIKILKALTDKEEEDGGSE
jgi:hypothetical protein